mmetsp:Transcript_31010/g.64361  ORF Transcript_31010/g.64361 Transcript_31010/m.64361 type:complete len:319 (-) Transcript_31010:488-1444(-)
MPHLTTSPFVKYDMTNLCNTTHSSIVDFVGAHDQLVGLGVKEMDTDSARARQEVNQGAGVHMVQDDDRDWMIDVAEAQDNRELNVSKLELLAKDIEEPEVPQQRKATGYIIRQFTKHVIVKERALQHIKHVLESQKCSVVKLHDKTSSLKAYMKEFPGSVKHSPTAWLAQFDSGKFRTFSKDLWQTWFCLATGQQPPQVADAWSKGKLRCKGCKGFIDWYGHHQQCCQGYSAGTWTEVHTDLQYTWTELSALANIQSSSNPADLPRPDNSNRHADIFFAHSTRGARHGRAIVETLGSLTHGEGVQSTQQEWESQTRRR